MVAVTSSVWMVLRTFLYLSSSISESSMCLAISALGGVWAVSGQGGQIGGMPPAIVWWWVCSGLSPGACCIPGEGGRPCGPNQSRLCGGQRGRALLSYFINNRLLLHHKRFQILGPTSNFDIHCQLSHRGSQRKVLHTYGSYWKKNPKTNLPA